MGLFDMLSISASALSAERQRAEVTSANLANAETTHTDSGGPYVRKEVVFSASNASPFRSVLNHIGGLGRPTAGSVRAYQLNASAVTAAKQMIQQSIDILKSS